MFYRTELYYLRHEYMVLCTMHVGGLVLSSVANIVHLRGEDVGSNPAWTILVAE